MGDIFWRMLNGLGDYVSNNQSITKIKEVSEVMIDEITRGKGKEDEMPNDILFSIYYDVVQQNELCSK